MKPNENMKRLMEEKQSTAQEDFQKTLNYAALEFHALKREAYLKSLPAEKRNKILSLIKKIDDITDEIFAAVE